MSSSRGSKSSGGAHFPYGLLRYESPCFTLRLRGRPDGERLQLYFLSIRHVDAVTLARVPHADPTISGGST